MSNQHDQQEQQKKQRKQKQRKQRQRKQQEGAVSSEISTHEDCNILKNWQSCWKNQATQKENSFEKIVVSNYNLFQKKIEKNRDGNFASKEKIFKRMHRDIFCTGVLVMAVYLLQIVLPLCPAVSLKIDFSIFAIVLVFLTALIGADCYTSIKQIEVHKYQETWARHSYALHQMQTEMVKYCETLPPYNVPDSQAKKEHFMLNMLDILDKNHEKFVDNMENKEVQLGDLAGKLILTTKG